MAVRDLTGAERKLVEFMLSEPFEGREALLPQAVTVKTGGSSCGCGCPSIRSPDKSLPPAELSDRVPVSASGRDPGGNMVGVLLRAELSPEDVPTTTEAGRRLTINQALDLARGPARTTAATTRIGLNKPLQPKAAQGSKPFRAVTSDEGSNPSPSA